MKLRSLHKYYWQGKLVRLRPMKEKDALLAVKEYTDSEAERCLNYGIPLPKTIKEAKEFAKRYSDFKHSDERIMFSIETLRGVLVGGINIHSMNKKNGTFQTGSRIFRKHRGKGYIAEAKVMVLRYCFHELRFQKYNVKVFSDNPKMLRHMKKLGCVEEGRIRRNIYTNGKYYDEVLLGMTREEFDEKYSRTR